MFARKNSWPDTFLASSTRSTFTVNKFNGNFVAEIFYFLTRLPPRVPFPHLGLVGENDKLKLYFPVSPLSFLKLTVSRVDAISQDIDRD